MLLVTYCRHTILRYAMVHTTHITAATIYIYISFTKFMCTSIICIKINGQSTRKSESKIYIYNVSIQKLQFKLTHYISQSLLVLF